DGLANREPLAGEPLLEIRSLDVVAGDIDRLAFAADFVHADDVRMLELGRRPRVAQEHLGLRRVELSLARNLDRNETLQVGVAGLPDAAELADADFFDQLEMAQHTRVRAIGGRAVVAEQTEVAAAGRANNLGPRCFGRRIKRGVTPRTANLHVLARIAP